jgi:hypothetical protein
MRTLGSAFQKLINGLNSGGYAILRTLTLNHPTWATPIYLCDDRIDQVVGGITYKAFGFQFVLPNDLPAQMANAQLLIDNTDLSILAALQVMLQEDDNDVTGGITWITTDPAIPKIGPVTFKIRHYIWDAQKITADLTTAFPFFEPCPAADMTPNAWAALFRT